MDDVLSPRYLRALPSLAGPLPGFDPDRAPADPDALFARWLAEAVAAGVVEPHAMTLSTVDPSGRPSARVLILKYLDAGHWAFASGAGSRKGKELANTPWAALTFYWPALGRQVRVRGRVETASARESAADFLARSAGARGGGLLGYQSQPLHDLAERDRALDEATARASADPDLVAREWTVFRLAADEVEFWQGEEDRRHLRLSYTRAEGGWTRQLLWP
ncbi:pyridoxamine 5'-phosphate oxidase [Crossiella equi]|uniref:Pyridoxamine 5'-phosphate oxidase n=1 Tax=Crossiella equi TaxID=130796 RepID=A0ABS5A7D1_9PSEU|nr:pyridoxal 5'-phosphate synthase [Crossiella equi]MBP2472498.1 pyridoxamine 5'-phosphate oxidase [Crossiella equi]